MRDDILNLILGLYFLGSFALQARRWHSWLVLLTGVFVACVGAWGGYEFSMRGQATGDALAAYFGQVVVVFASVVGGALVGAAFSELRAKAKVAGNG